MEQQKIGKPINVLLVDDDRGDVELTLEVINMSKIKLDVNVVHDGVEAIDYLKQRNGFKDAARPDLILLDLNMPKMNGQEVLDNIRSSTHLYGIPVVVLTTSDAEEDIAKTYSKGANCYITKPVGLQQFKTVVEAIDNFWFTVVKLPKENGGLKND